LHINIVDVPLNVECPLSDITYPIEGIYDSCFWKHLTDYVLSITYTCSDGKSFDSAKNPIASKT